MKSSTKVAEAMCLFMVLALTVAPVMAGTLTSNEIIQIEGDLGITLSEQEKLDLGAIVKPDSSPEWRTAAEGRIAAHRQASLNVQVVDSAGTPVPSAVVNVKMKKNAFKFGGVANVNDPTDAQSNLSNDGQTTAYWERVTTNLFNAVGANNGFKPKLTSQHQYLTNFVSWATNHNIDVRAHLLMWPGGSHLSNASTSDYAHYNVSGAYSTYTNSPTQANKDALKAEADAEIAEWAGRWDVYEWDVINETRGNYDLQEVLGYDQEAAWFEIGEANKVNPNAKLYINENQIISAKSESLDLNYYTSKRDIYFTTIDRLVASNAPIHGIGFQNRYKWEYIGPAEVYARLDDFGSRYGLQLAGTEFEIKDQSPFIPGEYTRAQMTEETLTVYYSHALAAGLNAWDYMENDISSLCYYDGTIKLNGLAWYYVHRIRYNTEASGTTDSFGNAPVVGYKGDYDITVSYDGTDYPATVTLSSNQTAIVTLSDVTLIASPNSPVFTVDPISKPDAAENTAYTGQSITNSATDADGDEISYSIQQGPAWLSVAENGDLSGTPLSADAGQNSWIVQASDGLNTETAVLKIIVTGSGGGGAPVTVDVAEDQYIHGGQQGTIQSLDTRLDTRGTPEKFARIPYLKFDVGSLPGTIDTATLNVYSETETNAVQAVAVADSSWTATMMAWSNAPVRGAVIGSAQASAGNWFVIDVTSHITGAGTFSIALEEQGGNNRQYLASSRTANGAELYITFVGSGNNPPTFDSDPVNGGNVVQDSGYTGSTLADNASDLDLDSMSFKKVSGPSWLNVATNGTLYGTPLVGDLGSNSWKVLVTDGIATNFATLGINVSAPLPPPVSPQNGTNILFIAIDDINPVLGCYGDPLAISTNIDTLAESGVTFLNAHCQWSVCGPSRASLMTGLMPEETGVMGFRKMRGDAVDDGRVNQTVKRPNVVTIPQYFRYNGYRTAATGKINDNRCVGTLDTITLKVADDGSTVDDPPSWGDPVDPNALPLDFFSNSSFVKADGGWGPAGKPVTAAADLPDSDFGDGKACDVGISLMQNLATNDTQFFLGVGFKKPHLAFIAPQKYWDMHDINDFSINPFQDHPLHEVSYTWNYAGELKGYDEFAIDGNSVTNIPETLQKQMLHGYYACVSFIDAQVGRLLAELETQGLADNTIVVLWGDHGFHLGDHAEWAKHTNLERATRVPFIVHNPFSGQSGVKTETPVALIDIYPTLCEMAGLPIPQQPLDQYEAPTDPASGRSLKGQSLAGVVDGTDDSVRTGAVNLFSRHGHKGYAYRTDRYRYTEWVADGAVDERELYDYLLDPMETVNLAGEPGYDALMYSFSQSMRNEFDAMKLSGDDKAAVELQDSPVLDTTAGNLSLKGIALSGNSIAWPDAAGVTYNLMSKTNLTDATWSTNQASLTGSPVIIPQTEKQEFYKVDVGN